MYRVESLTEGGERVAIFPNEMLERLAIGEGDTPYLVERGGEFFLTTIGAQPGGSPSRSIAGWPCAEHVRISRYPSALRCAGWRGRGGQDATTHLPACTQLARGCGRVPPARTCTPRGRVHPDGRHGGRLGKRLRCQGAGGL